MRVDGPLATWKKSYHRQVRCLIFNLIAVWAVSWVGWNLISNGSVKYGNPIGWSMVWVQFRIQQDRLDFKWEILIFKENKHT